MPLTIPAFRSTLFTVILMACFATAICLPATAIERGESATTQAASDRPNREVTQDSKDLPPRRVPPKRKGEISFDTIMFEMDKNAEYDPSMITDEIKDLENKVVKIRGFILPASVFQQVGIKQFVLVRDNQECCFGPGAALYDCIMVKMSGDSSATFSTRPIAVKGKFRVTEKYKFPDGKYMAIYEMEATEAE